MSHHLQEHRDWKFIWENVQSKIVLIITFSREIWDLIKGQAMVLNEIMGRVLKIILKVPPGTLREVLYIETGLLNPTTIITRKIINVEIRIKQAGKTEASSRI